MTPVELFSRRQSDQRGRNSDVLQYDEVPRSLRVQIVHIFNDVLGDADDYDRRSNISSAYRAIVATLRREYGLFELPPVARRERTALTELHEFILQDQNAEHVLDAVELGCKIINRHSRSYSYLGREKSDAEVTNALDELNFRFKQHSVGYRFDVPSVQIVRIDSELVHSEVVKPALALLADPAYRGVQAEFLSAYEHYRHQRPKEALVDALKSLESMAKTIADKHKWEYSSKATAQAFIRSYV